MDYCLELLRWNARVNLTGARNMSELVDDHLPDVFALSALCPEGATVVDVGSGGGLPGVPLALLRPDCSFTLVEPRAKRVAFLHTVVRLGGLSRVTVVRGRVEDLESGSASFAVARATFSPLEWLEHARRLVVPGGVATVLAARPLDEAPYSTQLLRATAYTTGTGAPRWAGLYCFT